jgi:hypothetical protein
LEIIYFKPKRCNRKLLEISLKMPLLLLNLMKENVFPNNLAYAKEEKHSNLNA